MAPGEHAEDGVFGLAGPDPERGGGGAGSSLPRAEMDGSTIWAPGGGEQIWGSRWCRQRRACRAVSHPEDALLHMFG